VRHWCASTPRPRLYDLPVRVRRQVRIPLRRGVVLMPEQRLDVVQRHPSCTSAREQPQAVINAWMALELRCPAYPLVQAPAHLQSSSIAIAR
jgi:hypothetical protein